MMNKFVFDRGVRSPLVITSGEPAGIGPDLCLSLLSQAASFDRPLVVLGDIALFEARASALNLSLTLPRYQLGQEQPEAVSFLHVPCSDSVIAGELNAKNAGYVLAMLDRAISGCESGEFAGMVTAPVHKGVINDAGVVFSGHTEYLAEKTNTPQVVMMLAGGGLRVALVTTHLPLADVSQAITPRLLESVIRILHHDLQQFFGCDNPRLLIAGLNPHAGESGHMGHEEIDVMMPVLERLRAEGMLLNGPLPADTLFQPKYLQEADAVLSMFHDQGLPVLKFASFGQGVNITLGLPIIRTSVDHGTALDLAATGKAEVGSLLAAIRCATEMANCRHGA